MRDFRRLVAGLVTALVVGAPTLAAQAASARPKPPAGVESRREGSFTQRREWRGEHRSSRLEGRGARFEHRARWTRHRGAFLRHYRWAMRHEAFPHRHHRFQHHRYWRERHHPRARVRHRGEI